MFVVTAIGDGIMWQCNMESNMRKLILNILTVAVTAMTIFSCKDARNSEVYRLLTDVDSYIESRPDSALAVLEGIDKAELTSKELEAKYALLMSMALDKNYIDRTDFEVLQPAIDYYENHGTATDKLRTFYYEGRIYYNRGEYEEAMECLVKSIELGAKSDDLKTKARNYTVQGTLYYSYYNLDKIIETSLAAAECYDALKDYDNYVTILCRLSEGYSLKGDNDKAIEYLNKCHNLLDKISDTGKAYYYGSYLAHDHDDESEDEILGILNEYLKITPEGQIDWLTVANVYLEIGKVSEAREAILRYPTNVDKNNRYYAILTSINKQEGLYKEALESYEKFNKITDSIDFVLLKQDTQFIEERHQLELKALQEKEAKIRIALICIIALLIALIAIYLIRKQLKIRTAEKRQLEIEKQRYEQLYADAIAERDALTKMVEDANVKEETKAVIRERLEILNKVIISHITDTSSANKQAYQELEALVADRESFIESTRLTIEGNNPEFIAALKKQGLTDEEINICCLYVIGLKGKDIKSYTSQPRHYNQSADIRHKLGLTENDTNLSIYLRELLKK